MNQIGYIQQDLFTVLYNILYISLFFCSLLFALSDDFGKKSLPKSWRVGIVLLLVILFIFLVGLRAEEVGTDTMMYYVQWLYDIPYESISEIIFYILMQVLKYFEFSFTLFLLVVSSVFYWYIYKGIKNLSEYFNANIVILFFLFISLFFSQNLAINIIRQGISLAFLFYFISQWISGKNTKKSIFLLVLAFLAHTTSIIPIIFFTGVLYFGRKIPIYYFIILYSLGIVLAYLNVGVLNIAPFITDILGADSRRTTYLTENFIYTVGFKPQFVAFNTVFLFLGLYIRNQKYMIENHWYEKYTLILKYFIVCSFLFFMAFQIPYSDRWGLFSWISIPLIAIPLFSEVKNGIRYKTLGVLLFVFIYSFFELYNSF